MERSRSFRSRWCRRSGRGRASGAPSVRRSAGGEEAVDELLVGVGRRVGDEGVGLLGRRRQADEVEVEAADEGVGVGFGEGFQAGGGEFLVDEVVDGVRGVGGDGEV